MDNTNNLGFGGSLPSADLMASMPWEKLQALRNQFANNPAAQQMIAPYEHRAYARESVNNNLLMAPVMAAMVPGYQAAKAIGLTGSDNQTTAPSWAQFVQGEQGVYDGVKNRLRSFASGLLNN